MAGARRDDWGNLPGAPRHLSALSWAGTTLWHHALTPAPQTKAQELTNLGSELQFQSFSPKFINSYNQVAVLLLAGHDMTSNTY